MDRVIKFRAWDKVNKWMDDDLFINSNGIIYTDDVVAHDTPNKEIEKAKTNNFVVMQFTGLTDRNGKEIYEGDILKVEHPTSDVMSGIFAVKVHPESMNYVVGVYNLGAGAYKFGEVIGNIYENSDLLATT